MSKHAPSAPELPYAVHVEGNAPPVALVYDVRVVEPLPPADGPFDWDVRLFDCFLAPAHCCMALVFPFVSAAYAARAIGFSWVVAGFVFLALYVGELIGSIQSGFDDNSYTYTANGFSIVRSTSSSYSAWNALAFGCALGFVVGVMLLRLLTRKAFNLKGSGINDCCASFWCSCCVLTQLTSQAERTKNKANSATTLPAYQAA
ncbi:Plac8 family protein, partial [Globisporangium splendens]